MRVRFAWLRAHALPIGLPIAMLIAAGAIWFLAHRTPLTYVRQTLVAATAKHVFHAHKLNVLLLGYQADEGTTDTMMLVHLDVDQRTATMVSIPRDSWVDIPGHGDDKINAAYAYGGPKLSVRVVSHLLHIPINGYVAIDPRRARDVVNAMGGLIVDVDENMNYDDDAGDLHIHLHKGTQWLNGEQVMGYIRFRHDALGDWARVQRQQEVLRDMLSQLSEPRNWAKLPRIMQLVQHDVQTDLTLAQLESLVQFYHGVSLDNVRSFTLPGRDGWVGDASVVFLDRAWARRIGALLDKGRPPKGNVLVANATGEPSFDRTVIGALRGGGWNVHTYVNERAHTHTEIIGDSAAARALFAIFRHARRIPGRRTVLRIGTDLAPPQA
jgi:LCP family protein required for cell wall assembly